MDLRRWMEGNSIYAYQQISNGALRLEQLNQSTEAK
jgi:hypothetical protein